MRQDPQGVPLPFADYLAGECLPMERAALEQWLETDPANRQLVDELASIWESVQPLENSVADVAGMVARVGDMIGQPVTPGTTVRNVSNRIRFSPAEQKSATLRPWRWGAIAAGVACCALVAWPFLQGLSGNVQPMEYTTPVGQRAVITLADGSRVVLNVATQLRVPEGFGRSHRTVELRGEAQFTVQHDAARPFIVRTTQAEVRDLATEFVVHAYENAPQRVVVRDGRVAVRTVRADRVRGGRDAIVNPSEVATWLDTGMPVISNATNIADDFAWIHGQLVLNGLPVQQALDALARWYGLEIRVIGAVEPVRINGRFSEDLNMSELGVIGELMGAHVEREGRTLTFMGRDSAKTFKERGQ